MRILATMLWLTILGSFTLTACGGKEEPPGGGTGTPANSCADDQACQAGFYCYKAEGAITGACAEGCRREPDSCTAACLADPQCDQAHPPFCNDRRICEAPDIRPTCPAEGCGPGKYCDPATQRCTPGCAADSPCQGECEICDEPNHTCREQRVCARDEDCEPGATCDLSVTCGQCVEPECRRDNQCPPERPFCDPETFSCVLCSGCPDPCDDTAEDRGRHCPDGYYCDETGHCDKTCRNDAECRAEDPETVCCTEEGCLARRCVHQCEAEPGSPYACPAPLACKPNGHCQFECEEDEDCATQGELFVCENHVCRELECLADSDCDPDRWCTLEHVCQVGCRADGNCSPWQVCALPAHECQPRPCREDADCPAEFYCGIEAVCAPGCQLEEGCPPEQVCEPALRVCIDRCTADTDCQDEAKICDLDSGLCRVGCRPDALEPNDQVAVAREIVPVNGGFLEEALRLCGQDQDEDWFVVRVTNQRLFASIFYDAAVGDLALELGVIDENDEPTMLVRQSNQGQGSQSVQLPDDELHTGTYYLRVLAVHAEATGTVPYQLSVEVEGAGECARDWAEGPLGNDGWRTAAPATEGALENLWLCPADAEQAAPQDEDWYYLDLELQDGLDVTLTFLPEHPLRLELWGPGGPVPELLVTGEAAPDDPSGPKTLSVAQVFQRGTYFLRILSAEQELEKKVRYGLELEVHRINPVCPADGFEPNDTRFTAQPFPGVLYRQSFANLSLCAGEEDWYQVELITGDLLRVTLEQVDQQGGNLDLELYEGGARIQTAANPGNIERLYLFIDGVERGTDTYLIRVVGRDAVQQNRYHLTVSIELDPNQCPTDGWEPNQTRETAQAIRCGEQFGELVSCFNRPDWFRLTTNLELADVEARVRYVQAAGELGLSVYEPGREQPLQEGEVGPDDTTVLVPQLERGDYLIQVFARGLPNRYSLEVACIEVDPTCARDQLEPNNRPADAYPIPLARDLELRLAGFAQHWTDLRLCSAEDEDWVSFQVYAGDYLDIQLKFFHFSDGDLDLHLFCGLPDQLIAESTTTSDNERLVFEPQEDTICWLQISGVPQTEDGASYSLSFSPFRPCLTSADCLGEQVCDIAVSGCVDPCAVNVDCGPGTYCSQVKEATDLNPDPDITELSPAESGCVYRSCEADADCPTGSMCDETIHGCTFLPCHSDYDCRHGTVCDPVHKGCIHRTCQLDGDCAAGEECDPESQRCVFLPCELDEECEPGRHCDPLQLWCVAD